MEAAGAVAALAVYAGFYGDIFVLTVSYKIRIAVVAAHTLYFNQPLETAAGTLLEAGSEVPSMFLGVESDGRLEEITVVAEDMGVCVLAGADDIVDPLNTPVCGIAMLHAELHDEEGVIGPVGLIIIIKCGIVDQGVSGRKISG